MILFFFIFFLISNVIFGNEIYLEGVVKQFNYYDIKSKDFSGDFIKRKNRSYL